jgi:hypothetical protein
MTPEAVAWLRETSVGMLVALLLSFLFVWYMMPRLFPALAKRRRVSNVSQEPSARVSSRAILSSEQRGRIVRSQMRGVSAQYRRRTATRTPRTVPAAVPPESYKPLDRMQREHARWLIDVHGFSNNRLYTIWGGTRAKRLAEFNELRADLDAERLAQTIADPTITDAETRYTPPTWDQVTV